MKFGVVLVALAASAAASPVTLKNMSKRDPFDSKEEMCKGWDLRSAEGVDKLWEETFAGAQLDLFLKTQWGEY